MFGITVEYLSTLPGDGAVESGVLVREIAPDSVADRKLGEWAAKTRLVIVAVNGVSVATPAEFHKEAQGKPRLELDVADTARDSETPRKKVILP